MTTGKIPDLDATLFLSDKHKVTNEGLKWPRFRTLLERVNFRATKARSLHILVGGQMACKVAPSEPHVLRLVSVDQRLTSAPNLSSEAEQGRRLASRDKLTSERR